MFEWIKARLGDVTGQARQTVSFISHWLSGALWLLDTSWKTLIKEGFGKNTVVYACIRLLSQSVPEPPLVPYTENQDGNREVLARNHPLNLLIRRPNEVMTEYEMWELATIQMAVVGRSVWWKERDNAGRVIALWPLRPDRVGPIYSDSDEKGKRVLKGWSYQSPRDGLYLQLARSDCWATNFPDPDGESGGIVEGLGPVSILSLQMKADNKATEFVGAMVENYGQPGVVLKLKRQVRDEAEARLIKAKFRHDYSGTRQGLPALLDGEAEIQTLGFSLRDLEFPALRENAETRICSAFGVPPILVGLKAGLDAATYSNYAQAERGFTNRTLANYWRRFATQFTLDVAAEFGEDVICEFDTSKVLALVAQRLEAVEPIRVAWTSGAATRNEYRAALSLPLLPPESGDMIILPATMIEVGVTIPGAKAVASHTRMPALKMDDGGNGRDIIVIPLDAELAEAIRGNGHE